MRAPGRSVDSSLMADPPLHPTAPVNTEQSAKGAAQATRRFFHRSVGVIGHPVMFETGRLQTACRGFGHDDTTQIVTNTPHP
jgi:hypothetical protein